MNTDKLEAIAKLRNKIQTISASIADLGTQRTHAKLELAALLGDIQVGDTITWGGGRKGVVSVLLPTYSDTHVELSQCGTPNVDGEPSMNCMECKLRDSLAVAKSKLSAAVDGLGIIHSHFAIHTQVCADKSCWKCYIGKLAAQILDKIEE